MPLLLTFLALAVIGQALNFFIAIQIELNVSEAASVIAFFAMLPLMFIIAWRTAVRLTEPAAEHQPAMERHRG